VGLVVAGHDERIVDRHGPADGGDPELEHLGQELYVAVAALAVEVDADEGLAAVDV